MYEHMLTAIQNGERLKYDMVYYKVERLRLSIIFGVYLCLISPTISCFWALIGTYHVFLEEVGARGRGRPKFQTVGGDRN